MRDKEQKMWSSFFHARKEVSGVSSLLLELSLIILLDFDNSIY
jgi:hypothetical protein